jgi:hypothetical protein
MKVVNEAFMAVIECSFSRSLEVIASLDLCSRSPIDCCATTQVKSKLSEISRIVRLTQEDP